MSSTVIIGAQWGDEGKGKIIDIFAQESDIIVRYQGGNNAGHTIIIDKNEFILHLIPSGILRENKICVIGHGVVLNPEAFLKELEYLKEKGISVKGRVFISEMTHMIMPYHLHLDSASEKEYKIGTTMRGVGPAYEDKIGRHGIRAIDLLDRDVFEEKLKRNLMMKTYKLGDSFDYKKISEEYLAFGEILKGYIKDTALFLFEALKEGKKILFEGAQGTLLDVDYGTYPFVTSSNASVGGVCTGTGIPPNKLDKIIGITKAYSTRVGEGPFPTELHGEFGEDMREKGNEYGATTGRPRRCGWFDAVALRYSARINGFNSLAITKLDVLSHLDTIKICVGYKYNGQIIKDFPSSLSILNGCEPVYEELPGWKQDIANVKSFDEFPTQAKDYLKRCSDLVETPIELVSVGAERSQTVWV
ncbi:adenylosuccinate synthase [Candidatus Desantisbacteria bacterium CG_4_9_14_3_um_filter_40_11]|uniref:Adenylosuccinate synthetase n=3 Tax=unclassified Candidatus Desantisiibacteriota TaxID=3106372 RepID=A0A2M7JC62_9BACT|nr:MAG: adenylosuccinate synthase [Candidatus Desantisbacteria bacterium CG23_combo_of_CG06-09_8_20_14_all_40_23]PIX16974.1 MAG: adenylosuccinate synthase [Candidatus Desantisbacteria bacterium CG_4_8_14_3_um_filter_40_12]PJB28249.1 MAG: adenylosuccinate synthase [Candidatus Desantisbacteria bacterium CG_4_9_14_3_um_filter_40_11]